MSEVLTFPKRPEQYVWQNYDMVGCGGTWIFGLPNDGQVSSADCGALPFRSGTGVRAKKCLRGEDWEFMQNWCIDRATLADMGVFPDFHGVQNVVTTGPAKEQLSSMYANLSALCAVWGQDFDMQGGMGFQIDSLSVAEERMRQCLTHTYTLVSQPIPPSVLSGNMPLELSTLEGYFTDMPNLACTIATASHDTQGTPMGKRLYYYYAEDGQQPVEDDQYISSLNLNVSYTNVSSTSGPLEFEAEFVGLFRFHKETSLSSPGKSAYCLYNITRARKQTLTQDFDISADYQFSFDPGSRIIGGASIVYVADECFGGSPEWTDISPQPPQGGWALYTCTLEYVYAVVWPKYLQLPSS